VSMRRRVLVVEDQQSIRRVIELNLAARSYQVDAAATGAAALSLARQRKPDLIILDLGLPDMDGLAVIIGVRAFSAAPIVVISARDSGPEKAAVVAAGADGFLAKPFGMDDLVALVQAAGCPRRLGRGTNRQPGTPPFGEVRDQVSDDVIAARYTADGGR
jgi:two-component system KDP operon response regulator KdpE